MPCLAWPSAYTADGRHDGFISPRAGYARGSDISRPTDPRVRGTRAAQFSRTAASPPGDSRQGPTRLKGDQRVYRRNGQPPAGASTSTPPQEPAYRARAAGSSTGLGDAQAPEPPP